MSEVSKQRLAIDLDEIERHLKQQSPAPAKDPLAELARIVGQDDPFRTLLAEPGQRPVGGAMPGDGRLRGSLDPLEPATFDDHLAEAASYGAHAMGEPDTYDEDGASYPVEPRRSRKGLVAVGAVLGVAVMGVAGAMALRGTAGPSGGEPPVIQADRSPSKVLPPNPGGVEIPNQDRQILERSQDRQTKIVNREEQPVDVRQATRVASAGGVDLIPSGLASSTSTSPMGPQTAAAAIGIEPKKVRTVSVRPDGTMGSPEAARSGPASPVTIASLAAGPTITSSTAPRPRADRPTTTPASSDAPRVTTGNAESAVTGASSAAARPQRVASATPLTAAALAEPTEKPAPSTGGFSVQLTTSGSEAEGRAAFKVLQQKFAGDLASRAPLIRKHEAEGKTVFRVRVGPMSKDEATSLCSRLKTAGGACFVAGA